MQQQQDNMHKNYKTTDEVKETQAHNQSNNFYFSAHRQGHYGVGGGGQYIQLIEDPSTAIDGVGPGANAHTCAQRPNLSDNEDRLQVEKGAVYASTIVRTGAAKGAGADASSRNDKPDKPQDSSLSALGSGSPGWLLEPGPPNSKLPGAGAAGAVGMPGSTATSTAERFAHTACPTRNTHPPAH